MPTARVQQAYDAILVLFENQAEYTLGEIARIKKIKTGSRAYRLLNGRLRTLWHQGLLTRRLTSKGVAVWFLPDRD